GAVVFSASLWTAKALGIVVTLGAGLLTRRAVLVWGAPADAALVAAVALMWMGPLVWGSLSGMEVSLAALLVAAALLAHGRDRPLATAGGAAVALMWMGPLVWGSLSGMEVSLAALLVAAALLAHGRDRPLATAGCAALAVLARPESLLLVPLFLAAPPGA